MTDLPILFDPGAVAAFQRFMGLGWPEPWRIITTLGSNWGLLVVFGLAFWLWGRRLAYSVLVVWAIDGALKFAVNQLVSVPRPEGAELIKYEQVNVGSFPSGHLSTAATLWGWLALRSPVSWLLAGTVIALVTVSRLYLGVHYVGDMIGGLVAAGIVLAIAAWAWPRLASRLTDVSFKVWAGLSALVLAGVVAGTIWYFGNNPYQWRAGGIIAGLAIALPLEYRFVRYRPLSGSTGRKALMVLIGLAGIAGAVAVDMATGELSFGIGFASSFLAALWTGLAVPIVFTLLGWSEAPPDESAEAAAERERDARKAARGVGIAAAVLAGIIAWGGIVEPRMILDTEEREAALPNLPPEWEGRRIAVVADFQIGLWLDNSAMVRRAVERIVEERPDVAILAGDFIYKPEQGLERRIDEVMEIVRLLTESDIPTYAVLGNHDWGLPRPAGEAQPDVYAARTLEDSLQAAGIRVLRNSSARLRAPEGATPSGSPLFVVGVGANYMKIDRPEMALRDVPEGAARFTVMHNPSSFPKFPAHSAPVAVAGHTHGGQFRIPFTPQWSWMTYAEADAVHVDGWVEEDFGEAGNRLYVNRGIGMSLLPMRLNCPPELTFFTLRSRAPEE